MRYTLLLALLLGGCSQQYVPMRDSVESFDSANGECFYRAQMARLAYMQASVYDACMRGRGWRPK